MVEWLISVLDSSDPCPPPSGSYIHLLLDRYLMEAAKVQQKFASPSLAKQLEGLVRDEIACTKAVLTAMGFQGENVKFSDSVVECMNVEGESAFPKVRRLVADTLLGLTPDGYTLKSPSWTGTRSPEEIVRDMVETSSHELAAMGAIAQAGYVRSAAAPAGKA